MKLFVGLGNPGDDFSGTRHNIGRDILEALRKHEGFGEFRFEKKWNAEISQGKIEKERVLLLLPDTFVNKSGDAVSPVLRFFKIKPQNLFLIHDDADIPFGSAKLSFGKRSAGHKGVESVIRAVKTRDFWRFRIGIGGKRDIPAEKLVLKKWSSTEKRATKKIIKKTLGALETAIIKNPERAMNEYNTS